MYVIREIMRCKPGKVGELVKRFKQMEPLFKELGGGMAAPRVMTDMTGERFWTVVAEQDVDKLDDYLEMTRKTMSDPRFQKIMQGYHEFVEEGRREIYKLES